MLLLVARNKCEARVPRDRLVRSRHLPEDVTACLNNEDEQTVLMCKAIPWSKLKRGKTACDV